MKHVILLNSNENTRQVEDEEKTRFTREILENLGIPLDNIWDENGEMSVDSKIRFRSILSTYNIQVIDDHDGGLKIYVEVENGDNKEHTLIGEWKKCTYVLKQDLKQIDPTKKLYLEMNIENWSIFENTE